MPTTVGTTIFKQCPSCEARWRTREELLGDPDVFVLGYQANFLALGLGLFLFNHRTCGSTLSVAAERFAGLYEGPVYEQPLIKTDECPERCLHVGDLDACTAKCECAWVREVLQIIRRWPKPPKAEG